MVLLFLLILFVAGWYLMIAKSKEIPHPQFQWETPKQYLQRTGSPIPENALVYCRWKKDGPMYQKLSSLYSQGNISSDPDEWTAHPYATALSLGDAHGEKMEILFFEKSGSPPPSGLREISE